MQAKSKQKADSIVTIVENDSDVLELDDLDEEITEDIVDEDSLDKQSVQILIRPVQSF